MTEAMSETATATGPERSAGEADGPRALAQFAAAAARLLGAERVDGPADGLLSDTLHRAPADRVLGQLDGVWVNKDGAYGIHTRIMPAPGTSSEQMFGAYHFITQE